MPTRSTRPLQAAPDADPTPPLPNSPYTLLSMDEAAAWLRVSRAGLYQYLNSGPLRSFRLGGKRRITLGDLEAFIASTREGQAS